MRAVSKERAREQRAYLKLRAQILDECDHECAVRIVGVCMGYAGNTHHILERSLGGLDVAENLLPVCGSGTTGCHGWVHANPAQSFELGYLLHSWDAA